MRACAFWWLGLIMLSASPACASVEGTLVDDDGMRNEPASRGHSVTFANTLSASLIDMARNYQPVLAKKLFVFDPNRQNSSPDGRLFQPGNCCSTGCRARDAAWRNL